MAKSKVLLLFPKVGVNPKYPQPPLSLLTIAPYIEEAGLTPVIIDQRVEPDYVRQIQATLPEVLFVGITSMTGEQLRYAVELITLVKRLSPETPIVFGGIHASLLPEQAIHQSGVDLVVVGEGESIIPDLVRYYRGEFELQALQGIYYKNGEQIFATPPRQLLDLEQLQMPAWHLIDHARYSEFGIQCGRGCPYACAFCYNIRFNERRWRFRKPAAILAELKFLTESWQQREILFLDDNFFTNFQRVQELCELIVKNNIQISWATTCRADYFQRFTPEFIALLKRSGLKRLFVGTESGSPAVLAKIKKGITPADILTMAGIARQYDLPVVNSFMFGFPFETEADRQLTYNLIDQLVAINPNLLGNSVNVYTPYPGNELFEEAQTRYGLVPPATLTGWDTFVFNMSNLPWFSKAENRMLENISFITRFRFWYGIKERFLKWYFYPAYWFLRCSALARWRWRFFKFAFEWDAFRLIRKKFLE